MLSRTPISPRRLLDGFWPSARIVGVWPGVKAFGGLSITGRLRGGSETLDRIGSLEVRFARSAAEVREAQRVRYQVFYREGGAIADAATLMVRRDVDAFDAVCDHLLVIDHEAHENNSHRAPAVVGTYRLLRQEIARQHGGFYSGIEYDIDSLIARQPHLRFLELGRSCVLAPYRNKRTLELLWHGIGAYTAQERPDVMIGCASLDGTDPSQLALPLSFLHHHARAPEAWRTNARSDRYVEMNRIPKDAIDQKAALRALPPLIKGYLRLGAYVGEGAVIDHQFGTTDVLIVLPVEKIKARYFAHFSPNGQSHAA
jgi:putative hemolysin